MEHEILRLNGITVSISYQNICTQYAIYKNCYFKYMHAASGLIAEKVARKKNCIRDMTLVMALSSTTCATEQLHANEFASKAGAYYMGCIK